MIAQLDFYGDLGARRAIWTWGLRGCATLARPSATLHVWMLLKNIPRPYPFFGAFVAR